MRRDRSKLPIYLVGLINTLISRKLPSRKLLPISRLKNSNSSPREIMTITLIKYYPNLLPLGSPCCRRVLCSMLRSCIALKIILLIWGSWVREWGFGIIWNLLWKGRGSGDIHLCWEILWLGCVTLMRGRGWAVWGLKNCWDHMPTRSSIWRNLIPILSICLSRPRKSSPDRVLNKL